jgi:hypothetical protein
MSLNAGQTAVAESGARFRVVIAGRRWGKTFLAIRETARVARLPNKRVFLVYPTYRQAKQVIWEPIKHRLQDLNWVERVNESDLTIQLRNGSRISLRGADNPDSLRGVGLDALVMDEFAMIEQKAWTEVLRPTLSDTNGSALFISTPMGTANWAYDLYNRGRDPEEHQWESWSFRTIDGGNVSEQEIEQAQRDLDERTFNQEYLATFESYQNRIYYAYDRALNTRTWDRPIPEVLSIGLDFNVGQMSAAVFAREGDVIHAIDEIALYSSNTAEMCQEISSRYGRRKIFVYPDPSGSARKSSASGSTDHTILANAGFVVKSPHAHNPVRDGINAVNTKLCNAQGVRTMYVDPKCKKIIESLEKHTYKENSNNVPDKDSGHDHFSDSIRYFVDYVFPIRRDQVYTAPQRWGHKTT